MSQDYLVSDEFLLPEAQPAGSHPMDSSCILLGLMALSRQAKQDRGDGELLEGVISPTILRKLLTALHFRDISTVRHARRTARIAVGLARYLGWEGRDLKVLEVSALLHDIGKIGVPDNILFKPGQLSPDEAELMALHRYIGIDVLQACHVDPAVLEFVAQSHSEFRLDKERRRWVGEPHLGARILAVADAYDSLSTDQVYRPALPHDEIIRVLMDGAGTQFDGNVVCALARWIERDGPPPATPPQPHPLNHVHGGGPLCLEDTLEADTLCRIFSHLYLLESLYTGFYLLDSDLRFVVWNTGAEKLLGHPAQELLGQMWSSRLLAYADKYGDPLTDRQLPLHQVVETGKPATTELQIQHWDGHWVRVEMQSVPLLDQNGQLHGVLEIFRDMSRSHRRSGEYRELRIKASRDSLTGVANRGEMEVELARMLEETANSSVPKPISVIFVDVDHFKQINDSFGHATGDRVLVAVARLLEDETYSGELVARYGGEEFVIVCPETPLEDAVRRAERLRKAVSELRVEGLGDFRVTASFGVTEAEPGDSVESVLRRADRALYQAKEAGRNQTRHLTTEQLLAQDEKEKEQNERPESWLYSSSFVTCAASDMIVYKLGGFVSDQKAKLVDVTPKRATLQLGTRGLLPFWGATENRQPVEVTVNFGNSDFIPGVPRQSAVPRVKIVVTIRPLGWCRDHEAFERRARQVFKRLREYFAGE